MTLTGLVLFVSGFPVTCRAPSTTILVGAQGSATATDIKTLADASLAKNYAGIMIWFSSVENGFSYNASWDTTNFPGSQQGFIDALNSFKAAMG